MKKRSNGFLLIFCIAFLLAVFTNNTALAQDSNLQNQADEYVKKAVVGDNAAYIPLELKKTKTSDLEVIKLAIVILQRFQETYKVQLLSWNFEKEKQVYRHLGKEYEIDVVNGLCITFFKPK